ncbi:hypothetical protein [Azospirillum sp. Marseille-Q6669]
MFLQRVVMPSGSVNQTAFDDTGAVVSEFRLGNHLKTLDKCFANLTAPEFDRFLAAIEPKIVPLHGQRCATSYARQPGATSPSLRRSDGRSMSKESLLCAI